MSEPVMPYRPVTPSAYTFSLVPAGPCSEAAVLQRLRLALKLLVRTCGLRVTEARVVRAGDLASCDGRRDAI